MRVREKRMKHLKYSILVTLALIAILGVGIVSAIPLIGESVQIEPYESNPQATAYSGVGSPSGVVNMYDGNLLTAGYFKMGYGFGSTGYFEFKSFKNNPPTGQFPIAWVDLKMRFQVPTAPETDADKWEIQYTVGSESWITLFTDTGIFDFNGDPAVFPWSGVAEPTDGVWSWDDIYNLRFRIYFTKVGSWDSRDMYIYEMWVTVYATSPKTGSTVLSVHPDMVLGVRAGANPMPPPEWDQGFVDLYITDVAAMGGYEIVLEFDTTILTPVDWFTYYPFVTTVVTAELSDTEGYVSLVQWTYFGDPEGFTGNTPLARIYFKVDEGGISSLHYATDKISDVEGTPIEHTTYDGSFSGSRVFSAVVSDTDLTPLYIDPTMPIDTWWHELYPTYSIVRQLIDWADNGDGYLSPSDQITMDEEGTLKDYHVDDMRITMHWTFKPDLVEEGAGEPWELWYELPADPTGSVWHQVYPVYCRYFEITGWTDNNDSGGFDPSDQFTIMYYDDGSTAEAHLDSVSIDIFVSEKPAPPEVSEFPLGIGLVMLLAPIVPLAYLWRLRKKVTTQ